MTPSYGCCSRALVHNPHELTHMPRMLELIDERNGIILRRNAAATAVIREESISAEPKLSGALARLDERRRADAGPIKVRLSQHRECVFVGQPVGYPLRWEMWCIDDWNTWSDFQIAGASDHQKSPHTRFLQRL